MADYLRILELRKFVQLHLKRDNKICSKNDINKIVKILEKHTKGVPIMASYRENQNISYGFYIALLSSARYDTKPKE